MSRFAHSECAILNAVDQNDLHHNLNYLKDSIWLKPYIRPLYHLSLPYILQK